jgi:hypothetical protein
MSETPVRSRGRLAALGAYGFEAQELVILAALTSGDPLLLIGRSGTGKTFLLNSISEALGLEHRHYNTSLISFDDLVGFPYPDDAKASIRFLETPATESSRVSRRPHFLGDGVHGTSESVFAGGAGARGPDGGRASRGPRLGMGGAAVRRAEAGVHG